MNKGLIQSERAKVKQAKSEQMDTRELNASGSIIWTDSGLNQDMPTFAKVHSPNANKDAAELVRRWNSHSELVDALKGMLEWARRVKAANPGNEVCNAVVALSNATK